MAPALSEARKAAVAATSSSRGERRVIRIWSRFSIRPWKAAASSNLLSTAASFSRENVSGSPAVQMPSTRTPRGPISAARLRMKVSVAASAGPVPPIIGLPLADPLSNARMTPDPCSIMRRAAARAVMKFAVIPVVMGRTKSTVVMSTSGIPCTSPRDGVEGHVDAADPRRHGLGVLVEGVEFGHLRRPASGRDVGGDCLERRAGATGEEDPRALPGEGPGDAAADTPTGAVDNGVLVLEQHADSLLSSIQRPNHDISPPSTSTTG